MKKNFLIVVLVLFCNITFAQEQKLNIVMIAVDDLNDWIGAYGGHPQVKTPNIDKLAAKGMLFRNASCPGPVCGPSRSALLSGFMPSRTGIYGNGNNMLDSELIQKNPTMPEYFSKHGYVTLSKGKIFHKHTTPNGGDHGQWAYDIWEGTSGGGGINKDKFYSRNKGIINGEKIENPLFTAAGGSPFEFGPTKESKENTKDYKTAKWFEERLQDDYNKPFFMSVGISKPHLPFVAPQEYFDLYGLDTLQVPEYRMDDLDDIVNRDGKKIFTPHQDFLWVKHYNLHKESVRAYMAAVSYADECVGVVLDALENSKYADNTIVMLWGDHGWHLGEKLKYRKASLWREATQLPFIVYAPGMTNGKECNRNVNLQDMYPTLIDLCGLPEKKQLDGKSIMPLLKNPKKKWTPAVTTQGKGNHSIITEKWHYIVHGKRNAEELYNLEKDPMEWKNLAYEDDKEILEIKAELMAYLKSYLPEVEADAPKSGGAKKNNSKAKNKGKGTDMDNTIKSKRAETIVW
jgi:arylsulfatase A-like enzyme